MNRVKDKVAIVTGAAQGIGQAISQVLAEEGAWVLVTDLNGERSRLSVVLAFLFLVPLELLKPLE